MRKKRLKLEITRERKEEKKKGVDEKVEGVKDGGRE